ncbi:lamin tail domain-containing protein [Lacipirellula parvula]|uniref:LTD domain-containing protein n=1 Tax=Lacipirellula parvula TaxID=2650471 RepID=A0A5K7XM49_9BACT|nr:lamin tail domain-containing protein [Lacipirellula parvula]BBO35643.1 hypothetical protein PLANPX_5255 [Lacipirellula parvula]
MISIYLKFGVRYLALALSLCLLAPASGSIILSEIMYEPQNGSANREWVELFNTGSSSIDLSGWQFGKPQVNAWTSAFPTGTTLGAGQALVLTPSASTFDSDWGTGKNRLQVSSFPALPNDPNTNVNNATIAIRNNLGVVQDTVVYRDGSGWPTTSGNDGNSIYVLPQYLSSTANDSGANWRPSSQGVYGAYWRGSGGDSENHASPGYVATTAQPKFAPSPDAVWSMVVVPDTQNYVARPNDTYILQKQMDWIVDNKEAFNIQVVLQEGDIVNRNSGTATNGVTAVQQWQAARDAFSTLNGVVPYIMATGNHDYGFVNSETRDTKFNTYFKATDNPLVDPTQGGILKGTMVPGELQNAYYEFTAPDGRDMLIFSLEFWPRDNVVDWAKSIAQQPQYADSTAVLLTHSLINSGDGYWGTTDESYLMEGGNDGSDLWNKLLKVSGNFEMTFNGHIGGDQVGYRVNKSNAGDDVHQMLINSQFETNAGNGWMRVLEFLADGETVRVSTYSPHFDLYRTNAANQFEITISPLTNPEYALVWNNNSGVATAITDGFATGNGSGGVGVSPASPWASPYNTGTQELVLGYNGIATFTGNGSRTIGSIRVGTDQADAIIAGRNGNGTFNANANVNLTVASTADSSGDFIVGEGGYAGVVNWNSNGTLDAQGKFRVGQGGVGTFNQNSGVVSSGASTGTLKYLAIGVNSGGDGEYNLNGGTLRPGGGPTGPADRQLIVGDVTAIGVLNIGNGVGAANSALVETDDDVILGRGGGAGAITVAADGKLAMVGNGAALVVGADAGSFGMVIQSGGAVSIDGELQIGADLGAVGKYTVSGGSTVSAADGAGALLIGRSGGEGTLRVEGAGNFRHQAEAFIGNVSNSAARARLEIIGSQAHVQFGQLENAVGGEAGVSEAIKWQADAGGVASLVIDGNGFLAANKVQLQDPLEVAANTGTGVSLSGDGIALELDLSAFTMSATLMLIDNRTTEAITGFFERGDSLDLYEEGAAMLGTGFNGTVHISYVGGTGNDVVLNLVAGSLNNADFNADGIVDGADFLQWQRNAGLATGAQLGQGDANGDGAVDAADLAVWKETFGTTASTRNAGAVPEPTAVCLLLSSLAAVAAIRRKR